MLDEDEEDMVSTTEPNVVKAYFEDPADLFSPMGGAKKRSTKRKPKVNLEESYGFGDEVSWVYLSFFLKGFNIFNC